MSEIVSQKRKFNVLMPDGTVRKWDSETEPKPDCVGNGSRNGFLYNCYTHPKGRFFQNTIKNGLILPLIKKIHSWAIPKYDPQAYVFDDPRLQCLHSLITKTINDRMDDADRDRKREIFYQIRDIALFGLKEDVFYRPRTLKGIVEFAHAVIENEDLLTSLNDYEAYNMMRFTGGKDHKGDFSDMPEEERAKLPKHWTDGSVYGK
jgi:hypothetical protein